MSEKTKKKVELYPWQEVVIHEISEHPSRRDSQEYVAMSDYTINRSLALTFILPRKSGHTFLANYIASEMPSILVYGSMPHFNALTSKFAIHPDTDCISIYEIYYALHSPGAQQPSQHYMDLVERVKKRKVIVIDNAFSVPEDIKTFFLANAQGIIVQLGH